VAGLIPELRRFRGRIAVLLVAVTVLTVVALVALEPGGRSGLRSAHVAAGGSAVVNSGTATHSQQTVIPAAPRTVRHSQALTYPTVGVRVLQLLDSSRDRGLTTIVFYPARASRPVSSLADARPTGGPYPLIVFGHGFAVTPEPYRPLLDQWVRAGFVVAAPFFPKSNANAPGGPNEHDLPNQPADMSFIAHEVLELSASQEGPLAGLISSHVAVAGQSDGGDTALAAAFDPTQHVLPVEAAVILSGAEDPFAARFTPQPGTPLLATQGTADTVNLPSETLSYFHAASSPKYLLLLDGAEHQPPYTVPGPQLDAVARMSIAFLDRYLKLEGGALQRLVQQGNAGPATELLSNP
jgi:dienelactone hydrolase